MSTRERILAAAASLFAERGYDAVSVRDITRRAGSNLGSVTYHFGGKEELFGEVLDRKIAPMLDLYRKVAAGSATPREKLASLLRRAAMRVFCEDPELRSFFIASLQDVSRIPEQARRGLTERNRIVQRIIQDGIDQGSFRRCDTEVATWCFFGLLTPYVLHESLILGGDGPRVYEPDFVEQMVATALDIFFGGIAL